MTDIIKNPSLKTNNELYHRMIEEIQDYAIILLDKNGIIQNWNKGAEKIKLYREAEIIGKHFSIFYLPEDLERNLPTVLITEAEKTGRASQEGWRKRKDGTKFWGTIVITALHGNNNELIGFAKVTRDLTDKKLDEQRLLAYTNELEIKNSELEQFAYVASHDLQEPLRKIQTFAELIQAKYGDEAFAKKYFEKLDRSAKRMSQLVKSLLNYSRLTKERSEITGVDLNLVLDEVKQDFELMIEEKHAIITSEKLPVIKGNQMQLGQLFANLVSNSLKFSEDNTRIKISSRVVAQDKIKNAPTSLLRHNYLQIIFEDNGIGFEQQYEKLIFSLFQRLHDKQDYAGTGIGLALCKKIVENHNGYITAVGELNKGAKFFIYLPVE